MAKESAIISLNLIVDIGNTRTKMYLFDQEDIIEQFVFKNENTQAIEATLSSLKYQKMIVSATANLDSFYDKFEFLKLSNKTPIPISINYKTPETLGTDRIALAVGAFSIYPNKNCLIIGTGTCITSDFIDAETCYQGGAISPGLTLRLQSLHTFTDKLPLIKQDLEKKVFDLTGKTTKESIESGVFNGTFAEIDGLIYRYKQIYKDLTVVLTGGDQEIFALNLKNIIFANANIQAIGLNRILNYNA